MATITCPNPDYTGLSATVPFTNGEGQTNDPHLIQWFMENGYKVVLEDADKEFFPDSDNLADLKGEDLRAYYRDKIGDPGEKKAKDLRQELRDAGHTGK